MRIRRAQSVDSTLIAALHRQFFPGALLSGLGLGFVRAFYDTLLRSPLGFGFLAEQDGRPLGFTAGIEHWRGFYATFVRRHPVLAARGFLTSLRQRRGRHLFRTSRYAVSGTLPAAEWVSLAVDPVARGQGLGELLGRTVMDEFRARGVRTARLTTSADNRGAARLFERLGWTFHGQVVMHSGEPALVYVISLATAEDSPA